MDIAKKSNDVLIEWPDGRRKHFKVANKKADFENFLAYLLKQNYPCLVGFEATGNYHRPIAYYLQTNNINVRLISSLASARTREALFNSWDKNDPKDAQVILHLLKTGVTQIFHDPLINKVNDIQELSKMHEQISLRKVKVQHAIMTHYLPLYFPESQKYFHASRAKWFTSLLLRFPCPDSVIKYTLKDFTEAAWKISGRKVDKVNWLKDFYQTAKNSIGLPVSEGSQAIKMFRVLLQEHIDLCQLRAQIENDAKEFLKNNEDYVRLQTLPGIGPVIALTILAEAGDLRRFGQYRQFLSYCGFDLSTMQSGNYRGKTKLSKRGNARLRKMFWMASTIAIRMRENTLRRKFERYIKGDPTNADIKRKGYTAAAAKMARVAFALIKNDTDYLCYHESVVPSGQIPSVLPLRQK